MSEKQTPYKLPLENDLIPRKAIYDKNKAFVAECDSIEIAESLTLAANHFKKAVGIIEDVYELMAYGEIIDRCKDFLDHIKEAQDE